MRRYFLLLPLASFIAYCNNSSGGDSNDAAPDVTIEAGPAAPYTVTLLDHAHIGSDSSKPDFQRASAPNVLLANGPFSNVNLVVDLTSPCFPFSNWQTDPPPSGQNWPADCDAFDRNFEMSLVDPQEVDASSAVVAQPLPALELVRAITPFGGPEHIEQDVTDAFNAITTPRTFQIIIPSYSDSAGQVSGSNGGWYVSAHLDVTPGAPPRNVLSVTSLIYDSLGSNESGQTTTLPFTLPGATTSTTIEYRVTGHGGATDTTGECIGPADEFCKRTHVVAIDGKTIDTVIPWRQDCQTLCTLTDAGAPFTYCQQNPCGDPNSVRAPRANWCPGSETQPIVYNPQLTPGDHQMSFTINNIAGDWRVSATVYAYGD